MHAIMHVHYACSLCMFIMHVIMQVLASLLVNRNDELAVLPFLTSQLQKNRGTWCIAELPSCLFALL